MTEVCRHTYIFTAHTMLIVEIAQDDYCRCRPQISSHCRPIKRIRKFKCVMGLATSEFRVQDQCKFPLKLRTTVQWVIFTWCQILQFGCREKEKPQKSQYSPLSVSAKSLTVGVVLIECWCKIYNHENFFRRPGWQLREILQQRNFLLYVTI